MSISRKCFILKQIKLIPKHWLDSAIICNQAIYNDKIVSVVQRSFYSSNSTCLLRYHNAIFAHLRSKCIGKYLSAYKNSSNNANSICLNTIKYCSKNLSVTERKIIQFNYLTKFPIFLRKYCLTVNIAELTLDLFSYFIKCFIAAFLDLYF